MYGLDLINATGTVLITSSVTLIDWRSFHSNRYYYGVVDIINNKCTLTEIRYCYL